MPVKDARGSDDPSLSRVIGVSGVTFTAFNGIVGAGIFGLPALVAAVLGPGAIIAYLVCAVLIGLVGLCFAEAGSRVSTSGGLYAYASAAFGPVIGGGAGILLLVANCIAPSAALARFVVDTISVAVPAADAVLPRTALLGAIYFTLAVVNISGARRAAQLSTLVGYVKLAPLVLLVIFGVFAIHPSNLRWTSIPSLSSVGQGSVLLFFAFLGVETGLVTGGEVMNPARTIPRAILIALTLVAALYVSLQLTAQGILGSTLASSKSPLAAAATGAFGPLGATVMLVAAILSGLGYLVADLLSSPRAVYALAHDRQIPRWFATVSPRYATPAVAISAYAFTCFLLAASGSFLQLVILTSSGTLILYLVCCLGVLRLRAKGVAMAGIPFRAPGGPIIPLLATAIILWLLSTLAVSELAAAAIVIVASVAAYGTREILRK
jgi:APA family basic amino acid/polyamine antiporter